jgi:hypothetical protein
MRGFRNICVALVTAAALAAPAYAANNCSSPDYLQGAARFRAFINGQFYTFWLVYSVIDRQGAWRVTRYDPNRAKLDDLGEARYQNLSQQLEFMCGPEWLSRFPPVPDAAPRPASHAVAAAADVPPPTGQASQSFLNVDLNGDGNPDSVYLSFSGLTVRLQAADGSATSTQNFSLGFVPQFGTHQVVTADFNLDGKPDLAISNPGLSVLVLPGRGDGTFGAFLSMGASTSAGPLAAADFNNDGKPDLAIANSASISILSGNGNGTFAAALNYPVSAGAYGASSLLALDLNGDARPDLAAAGAGSLSALLNTGNGQFGQPATTAIPFASGELYYLAYSDFNRDGKLDVAVACYNSSAIVMLLGNGNGTFQSPAAHLAGNHPGSIAVLPLSDGYSMVFTGDMVTGDTIVVLVNPQGAVLTPAYNFVGSYPSGIAAPDLNADGQPDVVTANAGSGDVSVLVGQAVAQFQPAVAYPAGGARAVAAGDMNGDGKPDVVAAGSQVSVLLGNGDGTLRAPLAAQLGQRDARSLALADFNGDGKRDAAAAAYGSGSDFGGVVVLAGKGDGTFQPPVTLPVAGMHPAAVAAADLNNDGKPDLAAVALAGDATQKVTLAIFLGNGNGTFAPARTLPLNLAGFTAGLAVGDLNGDGKPDLAATSDSPRVDILLGDGAGGFREAVALPPTDDLPAGVVIADVNGDGKPDLVVPHCCGAADATYLPGNGDATFQAESHILSGPSPAAIAVTKFPGSQGPDLVVANQYMAGGAVVALLNRIPRASSAPATAAPNPASGSGASQTFTFTFSDPAGWQNLSVVDVLINPALDGRHACYVAFVPSGASAGSVFLVNDAGDAGGPYAGLVLPGGGTVSNSQCTIAGAGSSVSATGNTLTLNLAIAFSAGFGGNKVIYIAAQNKSSGNSGWQALATWRIPAAQAAGPAVAGMAPGRTTGLGPTSFTFTFTDTNGWQDIAVVNVLVNSAIDGRHACYLAFVPSGASGGSVFLVNDAGDAAGPYAGMVLPGNGAVSNSQCTVSASGASVSAGGNTLTLVLPVTFTSAFAGNQVFFLAARSNTLNSDWQAVGSATVP